MEEKKYNPEYFRKWTLEDELKFISQLGTGEHSRVMTTRKAALKGYIESLKYPQHSFSESQMAQIRTYALWSLEQIERGEQS